LSNHYHEPQLVGGILDFCKGLNDWFYCLRCPYICTKTCPIENEDAFSQFSIKIKDLETLERESGKNII